MSSSKISTTHFGGPFQYSAGHSQFIKVGSGQWTMTDNFRHGRKIKKKYSHIVRPRHLQ